MVSIPGILSVILIRSSQMALERNMLRWSCASLIYSSKVNCLGRIYSSFKIYIAKLRWTRAVLRSDYEVHIIFSVTDEDWKRPARIAYTLSFCIYVWSITALYDLLCELFHVCRSGVWRLESKDFQSITRLIALGYLFTSLKL